MIEVAIVVYDGVLMSSFSIPMDVFHMVGVMWQRISGQPDEARFSVKLLSPEGKAVQCYPGHRVQVHGGLGGGDGYDVILVAASMNIAGYRSRHGKIIDFLGKAHSAGVHVGSICSGAFLLAETGLLDGKTATTHWGLCDQLQFRYPTITVLPEKTVTDEGDLYCSGGANSGGDLALHLVRKYCGVKTALQCSKAMVVDPFRTEQLPYSSAKFRKDHGDRSVASAQEWLERNYNQPVSIAALAEKAAMGRRTFERRFKNATGDSPLQYLQRVRVEQAKLLLENKDAAFDEITYTVGYEDASSFRRVFQKTTGLPPGSYRKKFGHESLSCK